MKKINNNTIIKYKTKNNIYMQLFLEDNNKGTRIIKSSLNNLNFKNNKSKYYDQLFLIEYNNSYYLIEVNKNNLLVNNITGGLNKELTNNSKFKEDIIKLLNLATYFKTYNKIYNKLQNIKIKNEIIKERTRNNITDAEILKAIKNIDCYVTSKVYKNSESFYIIETKCLLGGLTLHVKYFNTKCKGKLTNKLKTYISSILKLSLEQYINNLDINEFKIIRYENKLVSVQHKQFIINV